MMNLKRVVLNFSLLASALTLSVNAMAEDFVQVTESKGSLSKLIRSNDHQFWASMRESQYQSIMRKYLNFQGVIAGDPHFGNFSVLPLEDQSGKESLQWANIDFDDAGIGPFALDFVRSVVAAQAIELDQKSSKDKFADIGDMTAAYASGLNGIALQKPAEIAKTIDDGVEKYEKEVLKLIANKTDKNEKLFQLVKGELETPAKSLDPVLSDLTSLLKKERLEVLDVVSVVHDRGGSVGSIRLLALVKDENNDRRLYDIKQWQETSLAAYQKQKPAAQWVRDLYPVFWPGINPSRYTLIPLAKQVFWIREKKKSVLPVPYQIKSSSDLSYMKELAPFVANTLGLIHGRQPSAKGLRNLLSTPSGLEEFHQAVKAAYSTYIHTAEAALGINP
jgi:hypothetical protein